MPPYGGHLLVGRPGIGFTSRSLPLTRVSHRLAVALTTKLARHGSGVRSQHATKTIWSLFPQNKKLLIGVILFCGSAGDRTRDLILKRDLLYQLSYRPKSICFWAIPILRRSKIEDPRFSRN